MGFDEAWEKFDREYTQVNPPPEKPELPSRSVWQKRSLALAVIGASIFSTMHSIPTLLQSLGADISNTPMPVMIFTGIVITTMVEIPLFVFAFIRVRIKARQSGMGSMKSTLTWLKRGLIIVLLLTLVANIAASLKGFDITMPDTLKLFLAVFLGSSAPLIAWISGESFAMLDIEANSDGRRVLTQWQADVDAYNEAKKRSWNAKRTKLLNVERTPNVQERTVYDVRSTSYTDRTQRTKPERIADMIVQDGNTDRTVRELAEIYAHESRSLDTLNKARKIARGE